MVTLTQEKIVAKAALVLCVGAAGFFVKNTFKLSPVVSCSRPFGRPTTKIVETQIPSST